MVQKKDGDRKSARGAAASGKAKAVAARRASAPKKVTKKKAAGGGDDEAAKKLRELEQLKRYVRDVLKERGLYEKEMCYQVELLASDLMVFRRIRDEAIKPETALLMVEVSREGEKRAKENPIFVMMTRYADRVRKDLKALLMNREIQPSENVRLKDDDPLTELMGELSKDDD